MVSKAGSFAFLALISYIHCTWNVRFSPFTPTLTLTLIQPASKWMHWATLRRHSDLFWAATSTSSQVIPILNNYNKSLLTVLLQFVRGRPGPLLNPGTSQCNACRGMSWWFIRITCPSQRSLLSLSMSFILCCPVLTLTSSFVTLSFQEMPKMPLCHLWWAAFSLFVTPTVPPDQNLSLVCPIEARTSVDNSTIVLVVLTPALRLLDYWRTDYSLVANSSVERCCTDDLMPNDPRPISYSLAFLQAVWTPKFKDWRSSSIVLS